MSGQAQHTPSAQEAARSPTPEADDDCPICYEQFSATSPAVLLYCGHAFCAPCLAQTASPRCSICRRSLVHPGCQHACAGRLRIHHPPLTPDRTLEDLCIECDILDIPLEGWDELLATDEEYQEEKRRIAEEVGMLYGGVMYDVRGVMLPGVRTWLGSLVRMTKDADKAAMRREMSRWREERW